MPIGVIRGLPFSITMMPPPTHFAWLDPLQKGQRPVTR